MKMICHECGHIGDDDEFVRDQASILEDFMAGLISQEEFHELFTDATIPFCPECGSVEGVEPFES